MRQLKSNESGNITTVPELPIGKDGTEFAAPRTEKQCDLQPLGLHFLIEK